MTSRRFPPPWTIDERRGILSSATRTAKRSVIANKQEGERLIESVAHVEVVIRLFDPDFDFRTPHAVA
jgi:hypothetical protein